jgi:23S rRNA pseudouridine955/2504/2580 synthase
MNIIFEDDNVIVVHKPQGVSTTDDENSLERQLGFYAVHRLDTNTEGLVIFAKNLVAKKELEDAFKNRLVKKIYLALCFGKLNKSPLELSGYLLKDSKNGIVKVTKTPARGALPITTVFRQISYEDGIGIIEICPLTGRTHQIRAHLASIGISIAGDGKYGDFKLNRAHNFKKQCLCATALSFQFPLNSPLSYLNNKVFKTNPNF